MITELDYIEPNEQQWKELLKIRLESSIWINYIGRCNTVVRYAFLQPQILVQAGQTVAWDEKFEGANYFPNIFVEKIWTWFDDITTIESLKCLKM